MISDCIHFYGLKNLYVWSLLDIIYKVFFTILWRIFLSYQNAMFFFNNEHLILIWFFLLIDNDFDSNITLRIFNPENCQVYQWKSAKCCYFKNRFQYPHRFQYLSKIIRVIQIKKTYKLFVYSCNKFPVIDPNEHINTI